MIGFLLLGLFTGMGHALEADHLAAVGAMAAGRGGSRRGLAVRGAVWGLGHTVTLFAISAVALLLGLTLTDAAAAALEFGVGVMLVVLGLDVIRRLLRRRVHFHVHDHGDGRPHVHAHSHAAARLPHECDPHDHAHRERFPVQALLVGLVHGAAGSAGLVALAVAATGEPLVAVAYVAVFGLGSILGMAALSWVAAWPLGLARRMGRLRRAVGGAAAAVAITLGLAIIAETAPAAMTLL